MFPDSPLIFPSHHSQSLCSSFSNIYETLDKLRESTDDFLYLKFKLNIDGGLTYLTGKSDRRSLTSDGVYICTYTYKSIIWK